MIRYTKPARCFEDDTLESLVDYIILLFTKSHYYHLSIKDTAAIELMNVRTKRFATITVTSKTIEVKLSSLESPAVNSGYLIEDPDSINKMEDAVTDHLGY